MMLYRLFERILTLFLKVGKYIVRRRTTLFKLQQGKNPPSNFVQGQVKLLLILLPRGFRAQSTTRTRLLSLSNAVNSPPNRTCTFQCIRLSIYSLHGRHIPVNCIQLTTAFLLQELREKRLRHRGHHPLFLRLLVTSLILFIMSRLAPFIFQL